MFDEIRLGTGDLNAVCGIPPSTVDRWVNAGFIRPVADANPGKGPHRRFDLINSLAAAFAYGSRLVIPGAARRQQESRSEGYGMALAMWLSRRTPGELAAALREGKVTTVMVGGTEMFRFIPPPFQPWPGHLDLAKWLGRIVDYWNVNYGPATEAEEIVPLTPAVEG
jgi:hypothetical protein